LVRRVSKKGCCTSSGSTSARAASRPQPAPERRGQATGHEHHGHAVEHAEADPAARNIQAEPAETEQRAAGRHRQPAPPEARPRLPGVQRRGLPEPGAQQEEADNCGALQRPEGVGVEVLPRLQPAGSGSGRAAAEDRHPDDGHAAQGVQPVERAPAAAGCTASGILEAPAAGGLTVSHHACRLEARRERGVPVPGARDRGPPRSMALTNCSAPPRKGAKPQPRMRADVRRRPP
jgi:hypothetical protein